jgi:DNA-binding beta-propeller fold protein YncE
MVMRKILLTVVIIFIIVFFARAQSFESSTDADGNQQVFVELKTPKSLVDYFQKVSVNDASINLNPGVDPDGDEQGQACFTKDGNRIIIPNGLTNNVTILDWETQTAMANVDVGEYPVHADVSEDYAVIACLFDSSLYVIDLVDYSIAAVLDLPGQTFSCTISPDGSRVYGHCYNGDYSTVEVYNLSDFSHELTIDNLPAIPYMQSWVTGSGRVSFRFFTFVVSYANELLITPDGENTLYFYDLNTGVLVNQIDDIFSYEVELSLDGNTLVTVSADSPATVYQIDVANQTISDEFMLDIGYWAGSLSCNFDGNKVFFGGDNSGHIVDFAMNTHDVFNTNTAFGSATTADRQYVYSSNFKAAVFDFENKSIVGIHQGNTQGTCCVSPVGYKAFAYNNLFWEGGFFYDFASLNSLDYTGSQFFGNPPEGDIPTRVAITPDGNKAVVTNPGSWSVSIVDITTNEVTSVLELGEACKFVVITHDGNWAIASGYDLNTIKIIDLNAEEIVAYVNTNQRPGNMVVSPDDQYVYVMNIKGNTISKVLLDGENSVEVADFPCGTIGGIYSAYGIYSNMAITPDGAYLAATISFENHVKIIETGSMTSVAEINTGNMPLQIAINTNGDYATVTNQSDDTYSVIHVNGANSSLVNTFSNGLGNPIRVKYNPILDQMSIVDYQHSNLQWKVLHTNPETGDLIDTEFHEGFGATIDVGYSQNGTPVILTGAQPKPDGTYGDSHVLMGDEALTIGPGPIAFDVNPVSNVAVCACGGGGPDYISIVHLGEPVGIDEMSFGDLRINPVPVDNVLQIQCEKPIKKISILDLNGKVLMNFENVQYQIRVPTNQLTSGIYFINIIYENNISMVHKIIKK